MNSAREFGGALCNHENFSSRSAVNCIFWGNTAGIAYPQVGNCNATFYVLYSDIQGGYPGMGNIDSAPAFVNIPKSIDWTIADKTTSTLEIEDTATLHGANDVIEIDDDGVARTVSVVSGTTVTFAPALSSPSVIDTPVENWGPGATNLVIDLALLASSPCIDAGDNTAVPADALDLDNDLDTTERAPYDVADNPRFVDDPAVTDTGNGAAPIVDMGASEKQ
jgi:hypothetical protein